MNYIFAPQEVPSAAIENSTDAFPIHRIYCVGKNYAAHIIEMGMDPKTLVPCFFMKPADAMVSGNGEELKVAYPLHTDNYHYEVELVIAIGKGGSNIPVEEALNHVFGYAVGMDMTRRDLQLSSAKRGEPWDTGKGFDESAPLGKIYPVSEVGHFDSGSISLKVNGEVRQDADMEELVWKNHQIIARLSTFYELKPGDLIFTGTPAGVAAVKQGDHLEASIERLGNLRVEII